MLSRSGFAVDLALLGCLCVLGAAVYGSNRALEARVAAAVPSGDVGPLPDGAALRVLALGFDRLLADLFWLRTVYYVGDERSREARYPAVDRLAQLVTDVDPGFTTAYIVMCGAIGYLKGDPDAAIELLRKGIRHVDYWKLNFLLGFTLFSEKLDYSGAAREMERAARLPGSPAYLPLLASRLYASSGDPETALSFIRARLAEETQPETRSALEKRMRDLWITRDLAQIDAAIDAHRTRTGRAPLGLEELITSGALASEPRDPRGGRYRIEAGRAATDMEYEPLSVHRPYEPIRPIAEDSGADGAGETAGPAGGREP
jgi:hypothetical protein